MPAFEKEHLKAMSRTVEELSSLHQLNPNNTGIQRIDDCLSYSSNSGIFRADILSIRQQGVEPCVTLKLCKDDKILTCTIPTSAELMSDSENYISINNGTLKIATNVTIVSMYGRDIYAVKSISAPFSGYVHSIRTSRKNYVLECGLVVKGD